MRFDDFVLRAIEQLSQAVASILKLARAGMVDDAARELEAAYGALLGENRVFLGMVDSATLAHLLGSPEKTRLLAELSAAEAELCERRGEHERSARLARRAIELRQAVDHTD